MDSSRIRNLADQGDEQNRGERILATGRSVFELISLRLKTGDKKGNKEKRSQIYWITRFEKFG